MPDRQLQCMEVWGGNEPAQESISIGGLDAWVDARPFQSATGGGDVHYLSSCASARITRLFLADVSGHGTAVADVARMLRGLMREHVNHIDQRRFVARMNQTFAEQSAANIFATAVVCTYYAPRRTLNICNAGHPPPLLFRAREGRWSILDDDRRETREETYAANIPLGILDIADYEQFRITLELGDRVLCYTDSLIEARQADGELLGASGLLEVVSSLPASLSAEGFIPALVDALAIRTGGTIADDDCTIVLFTPKARAALPQFALRIWAPFRWIAVTARWWREGLHGLPLPDLSPQSLRSEARESLRWLLGPPRR